MTEEVPGPLVYGQKPVSTDPPSQIELKATQILIESVNKRDVPPSKEVIEHRNQVLLELQDVVNDFVREVASKQPNLTVDSEKLNSLLLPFGSYQIGVVSEGSDIDTVCVLPRYVKRQQFFTVFFPMLQKHSKITELVKIEEAWVPIISIVYEGIDIDISCAVADVDGFDDTFDLTDDSLLANMDKVSVRSINGWRTNDLILKLVPNVDNFRIMLRFLRLWAKARAVYGNVYGYFGGINLALLSAFICQRYPTATPSILVLMFYSEIANWDWPTPIYINTPYRNSAHPSWDPTVNPYEAYEIMPIITPAYPCMNSLRSATKSSKERIIEECLKATDICAKVITEGKSWSSLLSPTSFFIKYKKYIRVTVSADTPETLVWWQGTVEVKLKRLAINLENVEHIQAAYTYPGAFDSTVDPSKAVSKSFFVAIKYNIPKDSKTTLNISDSCKAFLQEFIDNPGRTRTMKIDIDLLNKKDIPSYVFPGGKAPSSKQSTSKKQAK